MDMFTLTSILSLIGRGRNYFGTKKSHKECVLSESEDS
jgi:hypothetical protein